MGNITFETTNESLESIINGLQPNEEDDILAICGSGDQAFALASKGARILAVDNDLRQIEYASERKINLKKGHKGGFLEPRDTIIDNCPEYTKNRSILSNLFKNPHYVDNIKFVQGDILNMNFDDRIFSKIYLSNILNYTYELIDEERLIKNYGRRIKRIPFLLNSLKDKGIVYNSSSTPSKDNLSIFLRIQLKLLKFKDKLQDLDELKIDEKLTKIACINYTHSNRPLIFDWKPSVYRKE